MHYSKKVNLKRLDRTLVEKARTLLHDNNLDKKLLTETITCGLYTVNRSCTIDDRIPCELWYGEKANYDKLRIFGCIVYAHVDYVAGTKDRKSKSGYIIFQLYGGTIS